MQGHANRIDRPEADEEIVEKLNGVDPARFLFLCGSRTVTPTVRSLIKGMQDLERIALWRKVEHQCFGGRSGVIRALDQREAALRGESDESDTDVEVAEGGRDSEVDEKADVPPETSRVDDDHDEDDDYEEALSRARSIVEGFDAETCRQHLRDERDRDVPRAHVIEALEERLEELGADVPSVDADASEVAV